MLIDASALTALLTGEADAAELLARMQRRPDGATSPLAEWEATIAIARLLGLPVQEAGRAVADCLALMKIELLPVPPETAGIALDAYGRYGKGRHPARLNFGDRFAYACARHYSLPLMFKGADFFPDGHRGRLATRHPPTCP